MTLNGGAVRSSFGRWIEGQTLACIVECVNVVGVSEEGCAGDEWGGGQGTNTTGQIERDSKNWMSLINEGMWS